jgi:hypothetical protein
LLLGALFVGFFAASFLRPHGVTSSWWVAGEMLVAPLFLIVTLVCRVRNYRIRRRSAS